MAANRQNRRRHAPRAACRAHNLANLCDRALAKLLARRLALAGIKAAGRERLSLHRLRAGFITEAYKAGARDEAIMAHSRHKDIHTMRGYVRRASLVGESPAKLVGL
jgi:integrase